MSINKRCLQSKACWIGNSGPICDSTCWYCCCYSHSVLAESAKFMVLLSFLFRQNLCALSESLLCLLCR